MAPKKTKKKTGLDVVEGLLKTVTAIEPKPAEAKTRPLVLPPITDHAFEPGLPDGTCAQEDADGICGGAEARHQAPGAPQPVTCELYATPPGVNMTPEVPPAPLTVAQKVDATISACNHAFESLFEAAREALGTPDSVKLLAHQKEWAGHLKKMVELVKEPLKEYVLASPDAVKEGATTRLIIGDWEVPVSVANQPPAENEPLEPRHLDAEKLAKYLSQKFDMPTTGFLRSETKWYADGLTPRQEKALLAVLANPEHTARIRAACLKEPGAPTLRPLKLAKTEHPLPLPEQAGVEVGDE